MACAAEGSVAAIDAEADSPLLEDCARGSDAAWRLLHLRYYPVALAFLRKLGVRDHELEDATQEVFLQMHRYLSRFRGDAGLKTWRYRLCITQARHARRKRRVTEVLRKLLAQAPEDIFVSTPAFCEQAARRSIESALNQMTENQRTVFVLLDMEGVSVQEVALILGCRESNVWRRLHDARQRLVRSLESTSRGRVE